jgi:hypothetical protein
MGSHRYSASKARGPIVQVALIPHFPVFRASVTPLDAPLSPPLKYTKAGCIVPKAESAHVENSILGEMFEAGAEAVLMNQAGVVPKL